MKKIKKQTYSEEELRRGLHFSGEMVPAGLKRRTLERLGLRSRATFAGKWAWLAPTALGAAAVLLLWILPGVSPEITVTTPVALPSPAHRPILAKNKSAQIQVAKHAAKQVAVQVAVAPVSEQVVSQTASQIAAESWGSHAVSNPVSVVETSQPGSANALPVFATGGSGMAPGSGASASAVNMSSTSKPSEPRATATPVPATYQFKIKHNRFMPAKGEVLVLQINLTKAGRVRAVAYDMTGRQVAVIADLEAPAGSLSLRWVGGNAPSGVYTVIVQTPEKIETVKAALIR